MDKHTMWRRGYFWAGIIGAILLVLGVFAAIANGLTNPSDLLRVNIANIVQNVLIVLFGAFLVFIFFKGKSKEDGGHSYAKLPPDSPEDIASLRRKRNLIFAFIILLGIINDSQLWILNNYGAGLTLINVFAIFDLLANVVLFYIAIQLFRDKKRIEKTLLYTVILYQLVEAVIFWLMGTYAQAGANLLIGVYFVYALTAPVNRKTFRIAQFIILPLVIIFAAIASPIDGYHLSQLQKNQGVLNQAYLADNTQLNGDYTVFLQSSWPSTTIMQDVQNDASTTASALQQEVSSMQTIKAEYEKQIPIPSQQISIDNLNMEMAIAALYQQQISIIGQLMTYAEPLDFSLLTDSQIQEINSLERQVAALSKQASDLNYKLENN